MLNERPKILVVEDESINQLVIGSALKLLGAEIQICGDYEEAKEKIASTKFDYYILDGNIPPSKEENETRMFFPLLAEQIKGLYGQSNILFYTNDDLGPELALKYQTSHIYKGKNENACTTFEKYIKNQITGPNPTHSASQEPSFLEDQLH